MGGSLGYAASFYRLRHWEATPMVEARVSLKAAQERLGATRHILLKFYAHVLDDAAAETLRV